MVGVGVRRGEPRESVGDRRGALLVDRDREQLAIEPDGLVPGAVAGDLDPVGGLGGGGRVHERAQPSFLARAFTVLTERSKAAAVCLRLRLRR